MKVLSVYDQGVFLWDEVMMPQFIKAFENMYAAQGYEVRVTAA